MPETDEEKVRRYTECLANGIDLKRALKRLYDLRVAPEVYKSLDTYRYVKRHESSPELAKYARKVLEKIFGRKRDREEHASEHQHSSLKKPKEEPVNLDEEFAVAMKGGVSAHAASAPRAAVDYSKYKVTKRSEVKEVKKEPKVEVPDSDEYQPALSSSSSSSTAHQPKKHKDYAPVQSVTKPSFQPKRAIPQSESLRANENMFKPRKERQKVFAGRRRKIGEGVPKLLSLCQIVLTSNIDMIDHVGVVPFELLEPTLNHATTEQLRRIIDANPLLADDADKLFHEKVKREFPKYGDREMDEDESWRDLYDRLVQKKQKKDNDKLERLTSRIGKAHTGQNQGRQTKVIDMAHTRVRSGGFFNTVRESQVKMTPTPSAIQLSQARKNVKIEGKAQLRTITPRGGGISTTSRRTNNTPSGLVVKKTAPLMAKCRKMLKR